MTRSHVTIVVVTTIARIAMMHSRLRRACRVNPQIDHKYVLMGPRTWSLLVSPFRSGNKNVPFQSCLMVEVLPDDHLLTSYWTTVIGVRDKTPPC